MPRDGRLGDPRFFLGGGPRSDHHFTIGHSEIVAPEGWHKASKREDKLVLCSNHQQPATITVMHFVADPTFEQFETLCDIRGGGERKFVGWVR